MAVRYRVVEDWVSCFSDPVAFQAGDALFLNGKSDDWHGHTWVWAKNADGKEGWVPDDILRKDGESYVAKAAFSAVELTCRAGEILIGTVQTHGWVLCHSDSGNQGWVPAKNIQGCN